MFNLKGSSHKKILSIALSLACIISAFGGIQTIASASYKWDKETDFYYDYQRLGYSGYWDRHGKWVKVRLNDSNKYDISTIKTAPDFVKPAPVTEKLATDTTKSARKKMVDNKINVRFKNPTTMSHSAAKAVQTAGGNSYVTVSADSYAKNGKKIDIRISLNAAKINSALDLSASTYNDSARNSYLYFNKYFSNNLFAINLGQNGSYGQTADIAVWANTKDILVKDLVFYTYDRNKNGYTKISNPNAYVDKSGFLHFYTNSGGDIIISNGELKSR